MIADAIGVLGCLPGDIGGMTMPQLQFVLRKRGRILWPRVEPQVRAQFSKFSGERTGKNKEQPSDIERLIKGWRDEKAARAGGTKRQLTQKERDRDYAFRIFAAPYLGDPDTTEARPQVQPFPDMRPETARAILAWAKGTQCPDDLLPRVTRYWRRLQATAG